MGTILILSGFAIVLAIVFISRANRTRQLNYIDRYYFHKGIARKLKQKHPHLTDEQIATVFQALRDYFRFCHQARKRMVAMPSQVVDDVWHEFILSTRNYNEFCSKAFGRFLHHTPAEAMPNPMHARHGLKRAWRLACVHEGINPKTPVRLPLLFAIDGLFNISNGFIYHLNCALNGAGGFCASDIGCSGDSGFDFTSSDSDSDSGCSGDSGCGGSCGGGGD